MKKCFKLLGIVVAVTVIGFSVTGCASTDVGRERGWSHQTVIPSKDYVVLGAVVIRDVNERTVIADLMELAIEMGGHDIINVRTTTTTTSLGFLRLSSRINSASAVVIKYTEDTLVAREASTDVVINESGVAHTVTTESESYWLGGGAGAAGGGAAGRGASYYDARERGFLGRVLSRIPLIGRVF